MSRKPHTDRFRTPDGDWIGPEELQQILLDEGYSGGERSQALKSILTELTQVDPEAASDPESRRKLLEEVRRTLDEEQERIDRDPLADDTI